MDIQEDYIRAEWDIGKNCGSDHPWDGRYLLQAGSHWICMICGQCAYEHDYIDTTGLVGGKKCRAGGVLNVFVVSALY